MLQKELYFPIFSLVVAIATLVFVLYSGQQQRERYAQIDALNAKTAEIQKTTDWLSARHDLPSLSSAK
jgi:hypothetical protein